MQELKSLTLSAAAKIGPSPLRILLVGSQKENFFFIREILERNRGVLPAELNHATSLEEAKAMLQRGNYDLILSEHETGDAAATKLLSHRCRNAAHEWRRTRDRTGKAPSGDSSIVRFRLPRPNCDGSQGSRCREQFPAEALHLEKTGQKSSGDSGSQAQYCPHGG